MKTHVRIVNLTNGCRYKLSHAEKAIENCAVEWVEEGVSVRSLSVAESIKARAVQAALRERMPYSELPNIYYRPCIHGLEAHRMGSALIREASSFVAAMA